MNLSMMLQQFNFNSIMFNYAFLIYKACFKDAAMMHRVCFNDSYEDAYFQVIQFKKFLFNWPGINRQLFPFIVSESTSLGTIVFSLEI